MKRQLTRTTFILLSVGALWIALAPAAQAGSCSLAQAAGQWGASYSGTVLTPSAAIPIASAGRFYQDSSGNVSGTETVNLGGNASDDVFKGKLTLGSHCTWVLVANVYQNGQLVRTSTIDGVYLSNLTEVKAVFRSATLPDGTNLPVVITVYGNRQFTPDED